MRGGREQLFFIFSLLFSWIGGISMLNYVDLFSESINQGQLCAKKIGMRCHFIGPKKLSNSRAQPSPTCPRNGYACIQNIMPGGLSYAPYRSLSISKLFCMNGGRAGGKLCYEFITHRFPLPLPKRCVMNS